MNKIGPFKVNVEGYKYTTFKTSLVNAPEGSYVVDKDNHIRNEYNAGEEVYVLVSKTAAPKKVTLKVTAVANEKWQYYTEQEVQCKTLYFRFRTKNNRGN